MENATFIMILLSLVATLFGLLILILGWLGNKVYQKLSEIVKTTHTIESDLHGRISQLDRRVIVVETKVGI